MAAVKLTDVVAIPCQSSNLDLDAIANRVNIVQLVKRPAFFVLNNCRASSPRADEAADALTDYGLPLAAVRFGSRVAFIKSLTEGKGVLGC